MVRTLTVLSLLLALVACSVPGVQRPSPPAGNLRWSIEGVEDLSSLDPARPADHQSNSVINLVFGGLVRLDQNLKVQPDGAERWQVSPDGRTYTFFIRRGLLFGDGSPATAHDFAFAINRALAPTTAAYGAPAMLSHIVGAGEAVAGQAEAVAGIRVVNERTLTIELESPRPYFLAQLTYPYTFAVPRALIEREGEQWTERAYGTGPFRVREWRPGEEIVLEANPHYWRGAPSVATITMPFFADVEVAYQQYRAGQLDVMGNSQIGVPAARVGEVAELPDARTSNNLVVRYVGFNNQRAPFDNVAVRQAFALATDKRQLVEQVLGESAVATDRILPRGMPGADQDVEGLAFDPVAARAALGQAGYPSGQFLPEVTLTYSLDGDNPQIAAALGNFWRSNLGVSVQLEGLRLNEFIRRLDATYRDPTGDDSLQMYLSVWGADYPDPANFISQQLRTGSPYNNGHWSHAEFDQLVDQADRMAEPNQARQRLELYRQAEQIALNNVGWLPLFNPQTVVLIRPAIRGLAFTPQGVQAINWARVRL